jgi:hypothetical protein
MVQRYDVGRLDRAQRTGSDGARVPASIARTGVQEYTDADGKIVREYRPADEVFAPASLATLGSIPVTIGHPGRVDAKNWRRHAVGHVTDAEPKRRADAGLDWLDTSIVVSDAETLERIADGRLVEVSMGYTADVVAETGTAPDGTKYDAVQRNIRFNHLALLEDGRARAGRGARLRLDSNGDMQVKLDSKEDAKRVKVDGIDCEFGSETHVQMLERRAELAIKRADDAEASAKAAQTELGTLKAKLDAVPAPVDVNKLIADELAFRDSMRKLLPTDYKFDGRTRDDVRFDAVGADVAAKVRALPEGQREGYLQAMLDQRAAVADRPTHAPVPGSVKADADAPAKYDPLAVYRKAFTDSYGTAAK